jgi:hypothetical protein
MKGDRVGTGRRESSTRRSLPSCAFCPPSSVSGVLRLPGLGKTVGQAPPYKKVARHRWLSLPSSVLGPLVSRTFGGLKGPGVWYNRSVDADSPRTHGSARGRHTEVGTVRRGLPQFAFWHFSASMRPGTTGRGGQKKTARGASRRWQAGHYRVFVGQIVHRQAGGLRRVRPVLGASLWVARPRATFFGERERSPPDQVGGRLYEEEGGWLHAPRSLGKLAEVLKKTL